MTETTGRRERSANGGAALRRAAAYVVLRAAHVVLQPAYVVLAHQRVRLSENLPCRPVGDSRLWRQGVTNAQTTAIALWRAGYRDCGRRPRSDCEGQDCIAADRRERRLQGRFVVTRQRLRPRSHGATRRRYLLRDAPRLPLTGCSLSGQCTCKFRKHADRRDDERRMLGTATIGTWYAGTERRSARCRRRSRSR